MGEGMKHGLTKAVLGMYLVSTFVFCVTLAKDDPSGRSIWARMRPDAGSLGMYCISSAYPNFTLPDAVQAARENIIMPARSEDRIVCTDFMVASRQLCGFWNTGIVAKQSGKNLKSVFRFFSDWLCRLRMFI